MLYIREWFFVTFLLFVLITIAALSFAKKHSYIPLQQMQRVFVTGAVLQEVTLNLPLTAKVCDLLCAVQLSDDADTDAFMLHQPLKNDIFIIPKKNVTSIYVTGAVAKSGLYHIPKGCRYNQLIANLPLLPEADTGILLRKRRVVLNGECIHIAKIERN